MLGFDFILPSFFLVPVERESRLLRPWRDIHPRRVTHRRARVPLANDQVSLTEDGRRCMLHLFKQFAKLQKSYLLFQVLANTRIILPLQIISLAQATYVSITERRDIARAIMEFHAAPLQQTVHAEQSAIAHARLRGEKRLRALTVNYTPCGPLPIVHE